LSWVFLVFSAQNGFATTDSTSPAGKKQTEVNKVKGDIPTQNIKAENQKQDIGAIPNADDETDSKSNTDIKEGTKRPIREVILDQI